MTIEHHAALAVFWMVLGACVGSFLNVCAYRIPRGMSLTNPRSRCPGCGNAIRARDNVPVLGWLILRGHCRGCRAPISVRYPAVELAIGLLFAMPYLVAVAVAGGDPWERVGAVPMLAFLVSNWAVGLALAWLVLVGPSGFRAINGRRVGAGYGAQPSIAPPSPAIVD